MSREGKSARTQILRFEDTFSDQPDERGQCVFETSCTLMRLATQVKGQLHQMLNEFGEDGYQYRWRHPFPMSGFRRLEGVIRRRKHPEAVVRG
jgi:hypothetical protein